MDPHLTSPLFQRVQQSSPYYSIDVQTLEPGRVPSRLVSLDVFTGICILGMILAKDLSQRFPVLGHSPWNGIFFADLLVPFILFSVGAQVAYSLQGSGPKASDITRILCKCLLLVTLGLFLDGGYFHADGDLAIGVSITDLRTSGFLQRIAVSVLIVGLCHVAVAQRDRREEEEDCCSLCSVLVYHWQAALMVVLAYLSLTFLLYVPDWEVPMPMSLAPAGEFSATNTSTTLHSPLFSLGTGPRRSLDSLDPNPWAAPNASSMTVTCGTSGDLSPACSAAGYIDRVVLGLSHLHRMLTYRNLPECEAAFAAQQQGTDTSDSVPFPAWCLAPFEPAGLLSTLGGTVAAFMGLHFGHILRRCDTHASRLSHTLPLGVVLAAGGWMLQYPFSLTLKDLVQWDEAPAWAQVSSPGVPFNFSLFSTSLALFLSGVACLVLSAIYLLVDYAQIQFYTRLLEWSGRNWVFLYGAFVSPLFSTLVAGFYWQTPDNNLASALLWLLNAMFHEPDATLVVGTVLKAILCGLLAGFLCWQELFFTI